MEADPVAARLQAVSGVQRRHEDRQYEPLNEQPQSGEEDKCAPQHPAASTHKNAWRFINAIVFYAKTIQWNSVIAPRPCASSR
jgi:hypothetical protein